MAESQAPELIPPVPPPEPEGLAPAVEPLPTVTVDESPPPPLGRSWAFDLRLGEFVRVGSHGPRETHAALTLRQWIDKCLHTERGALPIHPPAYGVDDPYSLFGVPMADLSVQELQRKISEALTFHPRIAAVTNMRLEKLDDAAFASFQVLTEPPLDENELLDVRLEVGA